MDEISDKKGDRLRFPVENDTGLNYLLPLYQFLRNVCSDAAHLILIKGFRDTEYVRKYMRDNAAGDTLYDFLQEIHRNGKKTDRKDQKEKKKSKGASSAHQQDPQMSCQNQANTTKRFTQIHNLCEHADTLKQITIHDLLHQDAEEKCKILRDLDLSFVLNVIANEHIHYRLDESVVKAVIQIKEIRNRLFHPKLNFTQEDFDKNYDELAQATETLYSYAKPGVPIDLHSMKKEYEEQVIKDNSGYKILTQLETEIHRKYGALRTFVPPIIVDASSHHERVIEDLPKFIQEHSDSDSNKIRPVLLCGASGSGKSTVLRNLASSSISSDKYSLVLYLDDWDRRTNHRPTRTVIDTSVEFWEQIYDCIKRLAQNTVNLHGFETVKAVIRECMSNTLFLVNWDIQSYGSLFKEMQPGTWVLAHRENEPRTNDYQVLKIKPFNENLIAQLLHKCSGGYQDVLHLYKNCQYKDMLTTPDMIKVFHELRSTVSFDTDLELIEAYVKTKLESRSLNVDVSKEVLNLGEVAFNALKNGSKHVYKEKELCHVDSEVRNMFLVYHKDIGSRFIHSSVQEFLAAQYVVNQPSKACKGWLSNAPQFMKVFKFACGLWCKNSKQLDDVMCYMEEYLVKLYDVRSLKVCIENQKMEPMEVDGGGRQSRFNRKKEKKLLGSGNPYKNPFSNWDYLVALDEVCLGQPKILKLFGKLLSHIRCWTFKTNGIDDRELKRIEIIIKKVKLNKESPVTIKLESRIDVTPLIKMWNKLKNIESLHECAFIKISVICGSGFPFVEQGSLISLSNTIVRAHCPVYITSYKGPLLCSTTPQFLKCMAFFKLVTIDVTVYDVASLCEILKCDDLSYLKDIFVNVELKRDEQLLSEERDFKIPEHPSLTLKIKYFDNIQKLLNRVQSPHNLKSLSIYDLYVNENFRLDLSAFENMGKLSIRCEPCEDQYQNQGNIQRSTVDEHFHEVDHKDMAVDEVGTLLPQKKTIPRHSWMLPITVSLIPPKKLERLLFRNMEFYNNSNNYLLLNILKKHNIKKIVILDSQLSLKGVRQVLSSHTGDEVDEVESMTKKLKRNKLETTDMLKLLSKKPRLSVEEREQKRMEKPEGKEIIITSEVEVCQTCHYFPCSCSVYDGMESKDTLDDLVCLIEDVYEYDIVSFNYTSKVVTVRKDVCGDVRVHCALPGLSDAAACDLPSSGSWLNRLFLTLSLAQCICLEQTSLTFDGTKMIIDYLKNLKTKYSVGNMVEPFSLTIRSNYHPSVTSSEQVIDTFIETIKRENIFTTFNFWCSCEKKCFKIKKAHSGKMIHNDRMLHHL